MSNIPQFPDRRPSLTRPKPTAKAKGKTFTFTSPEDNPEGTRYQRTPDGFKASGGVFSGLMAILFGGITMAVLYFMWGAFTGAEKGASPGFYACTGAAAAAFFTLFLFYTVGRESVAIQGDTLLFGKSILGMGFKRKIACKKIEKVAVIRRGGKRAFGWYGEADVKDEALKIETDDRIYTFGTNLRNKHLHYMRYLIVEEIKRQRAVNR